MDQTDQITRQTELVPDVWTIELFSRQMVFLQPTRGMLRTVTKKQGDRRLQNLSGWRYIVVLVTFSSTNVLIHPHSRPGRQRRGPSMCPYRDATSGRQSHGYPPFLFRLSYS
jgi:hypothetical protein